MRLAFSSMLVACFFSFGKDLLMIMRAYVFALTEIRPAPSVWHFLRTQYICRAGIDLLHKMEQSSIWFVRVGGEVF